MPEKGVKRSKESIEKQKATRLAQLADGSGKDRPYEKQVLHRTGEERDGFDFWPAIRNSLRPIHQYTLCKIIEVEIVATMIWEDIPAIEKILSKYFILK